MIKVMQFTNSLLGPGNPSSSLLVKFANTYHVAETPSGRAVYALAVSADPRVLIRRVGLRPAVRLRQLSTGAVPR